MSSSSATFVSLRELFPQGALPSGASILCAKCLFQTFAKFDEEAHLRKLRVGQAARASEVAQWAAKKGEYEQEKPELFRGCARPRLVGSRLPFAEQSP